jgi:hypothetical protein
MDIVIVEPTHTNMVQQTSIISHAMMMAAQKKTRSYVEQALGNDFIPLALRHMGVFILVLIHS